MPKNELDLHLQRVAKGAFSVSGDVFTVTGTLDQRQLEELIDKAHLDGFKVVVEAGVLKLRRK